MTLDEKYIARCIELARLGSGNVAPNPMVGSVIVHNNKIIGEGYHRKHGEVHAEVNAIKSVKNKELLKESTIYVSLEPCSHFGKTPPCANLIADMQIPNVVIGSTDTASHVSGKGIEILKNAGCNVKVGVLEQECRELNKRFFTYHEENRPYIILKWAQTKDGFIDIMRESDSPKQPTWISNKISKTLVHKWRSEEQAILIGTNTAQQDNPSLTTREWIGNNPTRIVMDKELKIELELGVFNENAKTIVISDLNAKTEKVYPNNVYVEKIDYNKDFFTQLFDSLKKHKIISLIVEGGEKLLTSFIQNNYWDEARIFEGDKTFKNGIRAPEFKMLTAINERLGNTNLYLVKK